MPSKRPTVLSFSGHDPSGGAGIQADIETIVSHRCHACSVITALTEQNTGNVIKMHSQPPQNIVAQARTILDDMPIDAFKIGLLGNHQTARAIHTILKENPHIPVVLDPILAAGGGKSLADAELISAINELLLPHTTVLTPNSEEARVLAGGLQELEQCALTLMATGCDYVLITGTHEQTLSVTNQLFHGGKKIESFDWNRLPENYHGSGCTLAASIAAMIACRLDPYTAILEAQQYTWSSLEAAYKSGKGQLNPDRFYWMQQSS